MIYYFGLEPYEERYTLQLTEWCERAFKRRGVDYKIIKGKTLDKSKKIKTGQVLDAHGRTFFAMSQIMEMIEVLKNTETDKNDVLYFEDMFHAGIESLPYIFDQIPTENRPKVFVRCLAQAIDPDDFVYKCKMNKWMTKFEQMLNEFVDGILLSNEEMASYAHVAGWKAKLYNISGLAFDKNEVQSRCKNFNKPFKQRKARVAFTSRFDEEKQPHFYMDLAELYKNLDIEFAIFSGSKIRSNNKSVLERLDKLRKNNTIKVYENLSKNEYYDLLSETRLVFNCALQDWTSNTVSEADALGCNVLFPAYRSFPEIFNNDRNRMYVPWSIEDAKEKLEILIANPSNKIGQISNYTHTTNDRIIDILLGKGEKYCRSKVNYRNHLIEEKY